MCHARNRKGTFTMDHPMDHAFHPPVSSFPILNVLTDVLGGWYVFGIFHLIPGRYIRSILTVFFRMSPQCPTRGHAWYIATTRQPKIRCSFVSFVVGFGVGVGVVWAVMSRSTLWYVSRFSHHQRAPTPRLETPPEATNAASAMAVCPLRQQ